eukprot:3708843-Pleurochrysis_carterae.AAC.2
MHRGPDAPRPGCTEARMHSGNKPPECQHGGLDSSGSDANASLAKHNPHSQIATKDNRSETRGLSMRARDENVRKKKDDAGVLKEGRRRQRQRREGGQDKCTEA